MPDVLWGGALWGSSGGEAISPTTLPNGDVLWGGALWGSSGGEAISPTTLPNGFVGVAYSQTLSGVGGLPPYTWAVSAGSLPTGLSLNANTGVISGTPPSAVIAYFTITVTDSTSAIASQAYSVVITLVVPGNLPPPPRNGLRFGVASKAGVVWS